MPSDFMKKRKKYQWDYTSDSLCNRVYVDLNCDPRDAWYYTAYYLYPCFLFKANQPMIYTVRIVANRTLNWRDKLAIAAFTMWFQWPQAYVCCTYHHNLDKQLLKRSCKFCACVVAIISCVSISISSFVRVATMELILRLPRCAWNEFEWNG